MSRRQNELKFIKKVGSWRNCNRGFPAIMRISTSQPERFSQPLEETEHSGVNNKLSAVGLPVTRQPPHKRSI
jgi:hypothetical protein